METLKRAQPVFLAVCPKCLRMMRKVIGMTFMCACGNLWDLHSPVKTFNWKGKLI